MTIKLSICIPTYNRAAFLGDALDSVIRQATDEVEIVISDNASTDNTEELVRRYQATFPRIVYHRNTENLGADRNYLKVVELAQGQYCWLLGSDDALAEGAIATLMPMLGEADVYLTDRTNMSCGMDRVIEAHQRMQGASPGTNYDCRDHSQLMQYFRDALNIGSLFSYISALIVRRSDWQVQPVIEDLVGSGWIHVAQIFQMMRAGARIRYVGQPLVLNRTGNDSFHAAVGYTRRRLIDLDYPRVARAVFAGCPDVLSEVNRIVARQFFNLRVMLSDKRAAIEADGLLAPQRLLAVYEQEFRGYPGYYTKIVIYKLASVVVLETLRSLYKLGPRLIRSCFDWSLIGSNGVYHRGD